MRNFSMSVDKAVYNFSINTLNDTVEIIIKADIKESEKEGNRYVYYIILLIMLRNSAKSMFDLFLSEEMFETILREMFQRDVKRADSEFKTLIKSIE